MPVHVESSRQTNAGQSSILHNALSWMDKEENGFCIVIFTQIGTVDHCVAVDTMKYLFIDGAAIGTIEVSPRKLHTNRSKVAR